MTASGSASGSEPGSSIGQAGIIETRVAACAILARQLGREDLAATIETYGGRDEALGWAAALEDVRLEGFRIAPNMRTYTKLRRENLRGGSVEVI
ncbi:hypothetical protein CK215_15410 [Mesorhizobium sp. WSM3864]|uniref:hypothetical protein n=1 Tax=Mesorhizobium sp. WSM3864 TaxID=2029404 RepID=UPI000BAEE89A|nr:hypothetical protein [Mesorhizobium sp. WSM3864]PBB91654.1 hypothetical protein CK215_15410 [Mesorhizobium sp. WSM3864]